MKRMLRLCNWQRKLEKVIGYFGFAFIAFLVVLIFADALWDKDLSLMIVRTAIIAFFVGVIISHIYFWVLRKSRNAVFDELSLIFKNYFEQNKIPLEVQCVSSNEYEYNNAYCVTLTGNIEIDKYKDLLTELLNFKSYASYALNKHVHIYCNDIRVC